MKIQNPIPERHPDVPASWRWTRLGRVVRFGNGADYKDVEVEEPGYPVYGSGGRFKWAADWLYEGPSVLFGRKGTIDRPLYVEGKFWTVDTMYYTVPNTSLIDARFLHYWSLRFPFELYSTSTALPSMTQSDLGSEPLALPPLDEQRRIVDYLDHETARIDDFINDLDSLSRLVQERFRNDRDRTFAELARRFQSVPLKRLLERPLQYGANQAADQNVEGDVRYLRITDFSSDGTLRRDTKRTLPSAVAANYLTEAGDVLLARSGATVGKSFLVPPSEEETCFAGYLIRVRPSRRLDSAYLWHCLQTGAFKGWVAENSTVATIPNVNAEKYGEYLVPVPQLEEQTRVAAQLEKKNHHVRGLLSAISQAIELARERREALISAAVTGQLDVTSKEAVA